MARLTKEQVEAEIATLDGLSLEALRERWRALYGNPAPRSLRRVLLIRVVAYQLQVRPSAGSRPRPRRSCARSRSRRGARSRQVRFAPMADVHRAAGKSRSFRLAAPLTVPGGER